MIIKELAMKSLEMLNIQNWDEIISEGLQNKAVRALEEGKVLYFPALPFKLSKEELTFLCPSKVDPKTKNISYDIRNDRLAGTLCVGNEALILKEMVKRYAHTSRDFLKKLIPHYTQQIIQGKTSFRPVEIQGRKSKSWRKDDTLLHVDAFPSNPTKGQRILRVFTNVNHEGKPRVWRTGEPFEDVIKKIAPKASHPIPGFAQVLKFLGITKDYRTPYDHYMLQIHDKMKSDKKYQQSVPQEEILFPAGCTWIVYTDKVSHAAMSGQHVLEQTFHMPVKGLKEESTSPLRMLEMYFKKPLI